MSEYWICICKLMRSTCDILYLSYRANISVTFILCGRYIFYYMVKYILHNVMYVGLCVRVRVCVCVCVCVCVRACACVCVCIETNKVKKNSRYLIRQYNIQIFDKIIFLKYRTRQLKATETNK